MPLTYDQTIAALQSGDRIMVAHPSPDKATDKITYGMVDSGKNIGARVFRKLLDNKKIAPFRDGPFSDGCGQTYGLLEGE